MKSNYTCAGFETLASILERFMKSEYYDNHFSIQDISHFFSETCDRFLHSYGQNFSGRKNFDKHDKSESRLLKKCREMGFFDDSKFIIDSGGFQISVGLLDKRESGLLFDRYYNFIQEYCDLFDNCFILDVPPGPGCEVYNNFDDVYKLNYISYTRAQSLPDEIRRKVIYIHHFRTPKLWEIYTKIMNDSNMFGSFEYHATGGIVANMSSDMDIPCIIYVIPLIPLVNQALKLNRNYLNFHILGGASFRDVFFYEIFRLHLLKKHGIEVNITYDSSGLFKGLMVGRFIPIYDYDSDCIRKMDLRTTNLDLRFKDDKKTIDIYRNVLTDMASRFNLKQIKVDKVYDDKTGTFYEENRVYSLLYMLKMFSDVQTRMAEKAKEIYPLYESGELDLFNSKSEEITRNINNGKITRKQKTKTYTISRSLDMLANLDEEHCKYIVDKFLSKDEFSYNNKEHLF